MLIVRVHIPGVAHPHVVVADTEEAGIADALYSLGMTALPEGSIVTTEVVEENACFSAI